MAGTPEPAVAKLLDECIERMNDITRPIDVFTLRRFLRGFQDALPNAPGDIRALLHGAIGSCYQRLRQPERALEAYRTAARLEPASAERENDIATVLFDLGRHDEGLQHLRAALAVPSSDLALRLTIRLNEALVHGEFGRESEARLVFDSAAEEVPAADAENNLRLAKNAAHLGYESDAVRFFARYLVAESGADATPDMPATDVIAAHQEQAASVLLHLGGLAQVIEAAMGREDEEDRLDADEFRRSLADFNASGEKAIPLDEVLAGHGVTRADLSG